ncbi:hypothetical protein [Salinithrix halophila]|uniref:ComN-like post-transcriptional regulator n=1 Tax=Salinithrix halophila TaxID=1485204 RepID=A0ABV8JGG2_9BACL
MDATWRAHTEREVILVYKGRNLEELTAVPLSDWEMDELAYHHDAMAQMSPLMNAQGISLHHQLIEEIERRGGLHGKV